MLYLKQIGSLSNTLLEILIKIQDICISKIKYPDWCSMEDTKLGEDEENFKVLRLELSNLYTNTLLINELKDRTIEAIEAKFIDLRTNAASQFDIELPLFLFSQLHTMIMREDKDLVNPRYQKLFSEFLKADYFSCQSSAVIILYYEV